MADQYVPLYDQILVRRDVTEAQGRIILPESSRDRVQTGVVERAGAGRTLADGTLLPLDVRPGDRILFGKYAMDLKLGEETFVVVAEREVYGVLG